MVANHSTGLAGVLDPYPGLRPFETNEEAIFRGRRVHVDELLRRLAVHRFLAVVGTSGSGKSSLVRAGLLPALDRGYLAGATSRWRVAIMRPGMAPIANLAEGLRAQDALGVADEAQLRSTTFGLVEAVAGAKLPAGESLLVLADQFEEIFRCQRHMMQVDGGAEAALLVRLLLTAARRPDVPVYVVLTMRSDFLGDCSQFPGLPEALSESQYLIPRLTREERRQAIEEPLRLFGASMTPQLVEQLLNDSGAESENTLGALDYRGSMPDPLPVLQHALMRTYAHWKALPADEAGSRIDLRHYRFIGRMESALDRHAEALLEGLGNERARFWVERIFRCLTTTELGRPLRRPTPLHTLYGVVGATLDERAEVDKVLGILRGRDNSFVFVSQDKTVDISHESLIWKWKRLSAWIKQEAASAEVYGDLVRDSTKASIWGEPKLSLAVSLRQREAWNADWARQYSDGDFKQVVHFLERSRRAVRNQAWVRGALIGSVVALLALGAWTYNNMRQLESLRVVRDGLRAELSARDKEQAQLAGQLSKLDGRIQQEGLPPEQRDQLAAAKSAIEKELQESRAESGRLSKIATEATTLQASVALLQQRLDAAQQELAMETASRRVADAKVADLETKLAATNKDLANARAPRGMDAAAAIVTAYSQLSTEDPRNLAGLASALALSGDLYMASQRVGDAEAAYSRALQIRRGLAKEAPATYLQAVANSQDNLGDLYFQTRRLVDAESAYSEALAIWRQFATNSRDAYLLEIVSVQTGLGLVYESTNRVDMAIATLSDAAANARQLVATNPSRARPQLASLLLDLGVLYSRKSMLKEAEAFDREAVGLFRELAKTNASYLPDLALALNNLTGSVPAQSKEKEGLLVEALTIYRRLTATKSTDELPNMALTLSNLARHYRQAQRSKEAVDAMSEAVSIQRGLAKANSAGYGDRLAGSLLDLADLLRSEPATDTRACTLSTEAVEAARSDSVKKRADSAKAATCAANPLRGK